MPPIVLSYNWKAAFQLFKEPFLQNNEIGLYISDKPVDIRVSEVQMRSIYQVAKRYIYIPLFTKQKWNKQIICAVKNEVVTVASQSLCSPTCSCDVHERIFLKRIVYACTFDPFAWNISIFTPNFQRRH